jgi:hypothetical protein
MTDDRYNRWQGLGIAQLSIAIALISSLSVAGLGAGLSLLQNKEYLLAAPKYLFLASLLFLFIALLTSFGAIITRLLDFRLTARKVRTAMKQAYDKPLTIFWLDSDSYGNLTWGLFWVSCFTFLLGVVLLVVSIYIALASHLL